ncbi:hypothetical protein D840_02441 [Enterococcus faecalis 20.SD.W.06]|nr:hypothetical protein D840_02441 [Enterococcus faecalis 20.SD.W.06]
MHNHYLLLVCLKMFAQPPYFHSQFLSWYFPLKKVLLYERFAKSAY